MILIICPKCKKVIKSKKDNSQFTSRKYKGCSLCLSARKDDITNPSPEQKTAEMEMRAYARDLKYGDKVEEENKEILEVENGKC